MNKKIGLVIQGPLMSIGRAGNRLHDTPEQLAKDGGIVHFDCRENIQRIVDDFGHLFDEIVVSTWDNEVKEGDGWKGVKLVSAPDPGGLKQVGHYKDNNKFRQFLSTLNGLKELEKSGIDYAIKTRTDTYLDIKKLVDSFLADVESNTNSRAIYATAIQPSTFLLHDLYFASTTKAMIEFCEAILAYDRFEFISSVHREMVLKHAYSEYREVIGVPDYAYFPFYPPVGVSADTRKIFDYMFTHVFFSIDPDVFWSTLWRGAHYEKDHVSSLLEHKQGGRKYNIPALISTDWERYFHFRQETKGEVVTLLDKIVIKTGKWGWEAWNLFRAAVNKLRKGL
ncbi:WavE lipopolysaccharide synthesis family protein [Candidatus Parcubacteria bacterium]|nr:WavE lipopolysaccharide synthesis family protein [Candidatus Parcubacteria bacterium]